MRKLGEILGGVLGRGSKASPVPPRTPLPEIGGPEGLEIIDQQNLSEGAEKIEEIMRDLSRYSDVSELN